MLLIFIEKILYRYLFSVYILVYTIFATYSPSYRNGGGEIKENDGGGGFNYDIFQEPF
jgi:hypothetical protein